MAIIPFDADNQTIDTLLAAVDGVLFTGGGLSLKLDTQFDKTASRKLPTMTTMTTAGGLPDAVLPSIISPRPVGVSIVPTLAHACTPHVDSALQGLVPDVDADRGDQYQPVGVCIGVSTPPRVPPTPL